VEWGKLFWGVGRGLGNNEHYYSSNKKNERRKEKKKISEKVHERRNIIGKHYIT